VLNCQDTRRLRFVEPQLLNLWLYEASSTPNCDRSSLSCLMFIYDLYSQLPALLLFFIVILSA
jgi:hypothetical protein